MTDSSKRSAKIGNLLVFSHATISHKEIGLPLLTEYRMGKSLTRG